MNNKIGFRCIIIAIVILNTINLWIAFLPMFDYKIYCINREKYTLVNTIVIDKKEKTIIYGKPRPLVDIVETDIKLDINGKTTYKKIYTYPESELSEKITVAVKDGNIRRCVEYKLTPSDRVNMIGYILMTIISIVVYFIFSKIEKNNSRLTNLEKENLNINYDIDDFLMIENKKQRIVNLLNAHNNTIETNIVDVYELEKEIGCIFNEHFVWCLEKFTGTKSGNLIYPFSIVNEEFDFVDNTRLLRMQGLNEEFYVISIKNDDIFCCCAYENMVFSYNRGIGLTKTKYFDVFDFIIETLEREIV